ncbi:hypothetical protein [Novosphingobium sp. ST904]|uniref:hypothetical protein n=1 Tax=Novosphingobium sp. ST904 TaxID=1684385 RepID=UPI001E5AA927|nr:hypothetical protein [Novosphingobium sp. ST904]
MPGFVDGHIHLDKSFFGETWQPHRPAASLRERLAVEKAMLADVRPVTVRADVLIGQAASLGTVAMRSHVDVDATTGLSHLHAVMAAREKWRGRMDIELVAFPQAGILTCPGTAEVLDAAIREGAEVIGGIDPLGMDAIPKGISAWSSESPKDAEPGSTSISTKRVKAASGRSCASPNERGHWAWPAGS